MGADASMPPRRHQVGCIGCRSSPPKRYLAWDQRLALILFVLWQRNVAHRSEKAVLTALAGVMKLLALHR